jgi:hypothetical protein
MTLAHSDAYVALDCTIQLERRLYTRDPAARVHRFFFHRDTEAVHGHHHLSVRITIHTPHHYIQSVE